MIFFQLNKKQKIMKHHLSKRQKIMKHYLRKRRKIMKHHFKQETKNNETSLKHSSKKLDNSNSNVVNDLSELININPNVLIVEKLDDTMENLNKCVIESSKENFFKII